LEGPNSVPTWGLNRFGVREFRFIGYQLLLVLFAIPFSILVFIPHWGFEIAMITMGYFVSRLSLVFPSVAIGGDLGTGDSWNATKNHQLMMIVVTVLFPFVIFSLETRLESIPALFWIGHLISALITIFVVSSLSVAYEIVMKSSVAR